MKAIITGHSRGLGAAIARRCLERGIHVLGLARGSNPDLQTSFPATLEQHALDLSDSVALARWLAGGALERALAGHETALLINNAVLLHPVGPLAVQDISTVAQAVAANVAAPLMLAAAFAAMSTSASDRRILHISSGAGSRPIAGCSVYCATKAALDHHARVIVMEEKSLRICSLAPGVIDTELQSDIRATSLERLPGREYFEVLKRDGMLAEPDECAGRILEYLLSPRFGKEPVADIHGHNPASS